MCNIAGYVGTRPAAPILLDMIRAQEGYAGGYYTGLATLHEGKLYYAKLTGDTDRLRLLTEASSLPGSIGIIHSRSRSGGGDEWAHPFIGIRENEPFCAYVANGAVGIYADRAEEFNALTQQLLDRGYPMPSAVVTEKPAYLQLKDGRSVHMSDAMCQLILSHMDRGEEQASAMESAFCEMPSEIVGLMLSPENPESITFARFNKPMSVAFAAHGAYLSSTPLAIPDDAGEPTLLPTNSFGSIRASGFTATPMQAPPMPVIPFTPALRSRAYQAVEAALSEAPRTFSYLTKNVVRPLFDGKVLYQAAPLCYDVLYSLKQEGRLQQRTVTVEGAFPRLTAPQFEMWL